MKTIQEPPPRTKKRSRPATNRSFFTGDSEMGRLMQDYDWSTTSLGPAEQWPQSLKTSVNLILNSRHPMWIGWGPQNTFLYNDAYVSVLGATKHPWALGRPASEVWAEIWDVCGPLADKVFSQGEATFVNDVRLFMRRGDDFLEETFYSFSYSPIRDESGNVGGLFCPSSEVTEKNLSARRSATLSRLAADSVAQKTIQSACASAAATMARNYDDVPFSLIYLINENGTHAALSGSTRVSREFELADTTVSLSEDSPDPWAIRELARTGEARIIPVQHLSFPFTGPAGQGLTSVIVLPLISHGHDRPLGALVAGVNPTRKLDSEYRTFFTLVASQLATAIANARAAEEERQRVEALAELDRAKTAFFNNVSHEFRTPLTLMLGPLDELLNRPEAFSSGDRQDQLRVIHRNTLRLLKLVNTLLDFSRIEAGRIEASYEPIDLAALTADLASAFRSAMTKAGLTFEVHCPPLPQEVFVDRNMWEKIVFNLLSNAFKFTLSGSVTLTLQAQKDQAVLQVSDTGTGIAEHELENVFKRFHRVQNVNARTYEGTGIGLALVHDLVKLHGGTISVNSQLNRGSTFTAAIPFGKAHLPADRIGAARQQDSTALHGQVFVEEAGRWSGAQTANESSPVPAPNPQMHPRVLVADDNADMRDYISRLLRHRYELMLAADGAEALALARENRPDAIVSDMMMPRMDGFALLHALREDSALKSIPIILLSARAGDEARAEAIELGADDYVIKPFSGRELTARIESHLKMARLREEATEHERRLNKDLERRVQERTASLQEAISQMEEFSYTVSHDLRSPVRSMQGYAKVVLEDYGNKLDEVGRKYLDRIVQSGARMDRLIRDVLTYSRVSRREIELRPVSLGPLVREVIDQNAGFASARAKIHIQEPLPKVIGHELSLNQVLSNLLSNAVKFVPAGVTPEIRIWSSVHDDQVRLWIEDNGIGIKAEYQGRLFGIFERIHPDHQYEGTGVGLAIVRKAMERLGGKVGVKSDGVHGSQFWIQLRAA